MVSRNRRSEKPPLQTQENDNCSSDTEVFRLLVQGIGSNCGTCTLMSECAVRVFAVYTVYSSYL